METLKYTVIKDAQQYEAYCTQLEQLVIAPQLTAAALDEIDLLTLLVETWDQTHATLSEADPIELLRSLMAGRQLLAKDLVAALGLSKGAVSDILSRRRGLSKEVIRRLASYFHVSQEAFNRPYELAAPAATLPRNARLVHKGSAKGALARDTI
ncbi:helix-turn-helix domain-containing protein [Hymenobacter psoromatis]|uniref:helix-turn-helix domain-containing protein n=1 Tax=Hymenobacter psoromatis TaxID=1484116 RepID=UPI001CBD0181|nr:helix-turn-helix domain-containing protein [Hymenobacter psoromatis]